MRKLLSAAAVLIAATTVAHAQNCLSQSDAGNTKCITGVLYRCACSQTVGSTLCAWNNTAVACSAVSNDGDGSRAAKSTVSIRSRIVPSLGAPSRIIGSRQRPL